jgi:UDPglucose--hexose-1-phosphate uridylyltransferase
MPEYRCDPLTGQTVLVAEERASRPHQFDIENTGLPDNDSSEQRRVHCPFCEGNEAMTPGELAAYRSAGLSPNGSLSDTADWLVRVFPNKYPAVRRDDTQFPDILSFQHYLNGTISGNMQLPQAAEGVGHHEVIVETPRHILSVSEMSKTETENMFRIYGERLNSLRKENRWAFVQIFKNVGAAAGASIPHSHSQLIAMPFVPYSFLQMMKNAADYRDKTQRCYWCSMLESELRYQKRLIEETEHFIAMCPFASRFAGEVKIYPKEHQPHFADILTDSTTPDSSGQVLSDLAVLVKRTVQRLEKVTSQMNGTAAHSKLAYNFVLQTSPFAVPAEYDNSGEQELFHWSLSILPSLARAAGFEWGTGLHINPVSPETAAAQLKSIDL